MVKMKQHKEYVQTIFSIKHLILHAEIDGYEVKNPEQYRIDSPSGGFQFTAVEDNPVGIPPGNGTGVSDGFWILLKPLKPGEHTITFSGKINFTDVPDTNDF